MPVLKLRWLNDDVPPPACFHRDEDVKPPPLDALEPTPPPPAAGLRSQRVPLNENFVVSGMVGAPPIGFPNPGTAKDTPNFDPDDAGEPPKSMSRTVMVPPP